ncbi:hypothetical protein [Pseudomonas petrae]|uniref:Uncharacterized protein n=1 Tax=Pseudomonas petrae TaxID=2912190 RepID=A0ABS9ICS0_9PSED|nr:hypothetical protein [Pseudomonas petrae]MCF7532057.1 hypothetical protein [Pseudomonas petrae]MCF7537613.1 hypothetical protein [Pseudomonas petrae]MCF7545497.1 hypothetical protein [Pseudomonas petrae]
MRGVEVFQNAYDSLVKRYAGLTQDVFLVPPDHMSADTDLLDLCGVRYDEKLYFNDAKADLKGYDLSGAGGITINFLLSGVGRSAVFVNENCLQTDTREDLIWLWRYNALHHELMHALDFGKQKNFNTSLRTMDLVGAEVFADQKTLLHLKSMSSDGYMKVALQQYAQNAQTMGRKGGIRTDIYNRLLKKIDSKTLDYWASMEI